MLPNWLDPYGCTIERKINLVTGCDSQTVAHRFRNHYLPLGADTGSHTDEYNFQRLLDSPGERNASYVVSTL